MRDGERNGDAAGKPDASRDHDIRKAGRDEERDARFVEIPGAAGKRRGNATRRLREVEVGEDAVRGDDGETIGGDISILAPLRMRCSSNGSSLRGPVAAIVVLGSPAMQRLVFAAAFVCVAAGAAAQGNATTAVYRYRAAIAALLQLKPGMVAAEVGSGPGVIGPEMAPLVAPGGRVIAATLDRKSASTNLEPASVDAVALIAVFGVVDQHRQLLEKLAAALKPGGALLVVDVPQENDGKKVTGIEADEVVQLATAAGLKREAESGIVPGHYAIRFRKP